MMLCRQLRIVHERLLASCSPVLRSLSSFEQVWMSLPSSSSALASVSMSALMISVLLEIEELVVVEIVVEIPGLLGFVQGAQLVPSRHFRALDLDDRRLALAFVQGPRLLDPRQTCTRYRPAFAGRCCFCCW